MMMFKNIFVALLLISLNVHSQKYTPTDAGSRVHFVIKNFGINTGGDFTGIKGQIVFSPESLSESKFEVTVASSTVDTDNDMRDDNLKEEEYFNAAKFPVIKIVSTKISKTNKTAEGFYFFNGNLTIKGTTKTISFPFQVKKVNDNYFFTGSFDIDRTDFGVGESNMVLSNKVAVTLAVKAIKS